MSTQSQNLFTFKHKEQEPRYINVLIILLVLLSSCALCSSKEELVIPLLTIDLLFAFSLGILFYSYERFNFFYIVTLDDNLFSISVPIMSSVHTTYFSRKTDYHFNEKSRFVYMNNTTGVQCRFSYDESFRKFLEEIQINN